MRFQMIDSKEKDVYINPTSDPNILLDRYSAGALKICENQYGPYLLWQRCDLGLKDGSEWDIIHNFGDCTKQNFHSTPAIDKTIEKSIHEDEQLEIIDSDDRPTPSIKGDGPALTCKRDTLDASISSPDLKGKSDPKTVKKIHGLKSVRFELADLKCYRSISLMTKSHPEATKFMSSPENFSTVSSSQHKPPYFIFILKDGTTYPPLQFSNTADSDRFVECILKYLEIKRSYKENDMYIVKDHRAIALEKSFNELNLFGDKTEEDIVSKFIKDPYTTTFSGFSKVARLVYDTLTVPPPTEGTPNNSLHAHKSKSTANASKFSAKKLSLPASFHNARASSYDTFNNFYDDIFTGTQLVPYIYYCPAPGKKLSHTLPYSQNIIYTSDKYYPKNLANHTSSDVTLLINELTALDQHQHQTVDITQGESDFQLINCNEIPDRPEIERGSPLTKSQWNKYIDSQGRITHPQTLKHIIFKGGICPDMRREVWKYLLSYYPWDYTTEQRVAYVKKKRDDYFRIKLQWKSIDEEQEKNFTKLRERKSLIEKDVHRTDRTHPYYQGDKNPHLTVQYEILMTYTMYNFDIGYVQGMSDLLTPILYIMDDEIDGFWCFAHCMERMQNNFHMDQEAMKLQLIQLYNLLAFVDPQFAIYLDRHESGNMYFCFRWLLILFKREFSFDDVLKVWEVFWTDLPCKNFHLLFCVALLEEEKHTITENRFGLTEILKHINDIANTIDLDKMLKSAEAIWYQIKECRNITPKIANILGITHPNF